jgi:septum formation topological specificity factor MinE
MIFSHLCDALTSERRSGQSARQRLKIMVAGSKSPENLLL